MILVLIAFEIVLLALVIRLMRRPDVSIVLSTSLGCFVLMWHVVPVFIAVLLWNSLDRTPLVDFDSFARMALLDAMTLSLGLAFLLRRKPYFARFTRSAMARERVGSSAAVLVVALGLALDWYTMMGYGETLGATYIERNAFAVTGEETAAFRHIGLLSFGHVVLTGFAFAALLSRWPSGFGAYLLRCAIGIWVAVITLQGLLEGSRISGLLPLLLLVLLGTARRWSLPQFVTRIGAAGAVTLVAGGIAVIVIGEYRSSQAMTGRDIVAGGVDLVRTSRSPAGLGRSLLGEVVTKFDSFSTGALLLERLGNGAGGWRPYEGALLSLVPRQFVDAKPVPGSADGTYAGHPSRVVAVLAGMDPDSGNVNVCSAAIVMWQLGYAGLGLLALSNALYWYVLNTLLLSPGLLPRALGLSAFGLPTFLTLYPTPDAVLLMVERLVALCLLILPAMVLTRRLGGVFRGRRVGQGSAPQGVRSFAR